MHDNMPPRMRHRTQKSGKTYYYYDVGGRPRKEIPLGSSYPLAIKKWAELEGTPNHKAAIITLVHVASEYRIKVMPGKATRSQSNNEAELKILLEFFGDDAPIDKIIPLHVQQFMEWRSKDNPKRKGAPVSANREKALLSHMFNMARKWGLTSLANPCTGIGSNKEEGRDVYIEDDIFEAIYQSACQPIKDGMDLAYLAGQRLADTLKFSELDIKNGALAVDQNKTGKRLRVHMQEQLERVITDIIERKKAFKVRTLQLVCNETGRPMRKNAFQRRFYRARAKAASLHPSKAEQILEAQFRDIRAKASTDKLIATGDITQSQKLLGHTTVAMTESYTRKRVGELVDSTR